MCNLSLDVIMKDIESLMDVYFPFCNIVHNPIKDHFSITSGGTKEFLAAEQSTVVLEFIF